MRVCAPPVGKPTHCRFPAEISQIGSRNSPNHPENNDFRDALTYRSKFGAERCRQPFEHARRNGEITCLFNRLKRFPDSFCEVWCPMP
jgi:hypothetical protein